MVCAAHVLQNSQRETAICRQTLAKVQQDQQQQKQQQEQKQAQKKQAKDLKSVLDNIA
jgi:hypothetical protein